MFLSLRDVVAQDLRLLAKLSPALVGELCGTALTFLAQGARRGAFRKAAAALGVEEEAVAGAVMALLEVSLEAARYNLSAPEFAGSLADISMPEENRRAVADFFAANRAALRERVAAAGGAGGGAGAGAGAGGAGEVGVGASPSVPEFRGLDWRFEVMVARRHALDALEPRFMLRLDTAAPAVAGGAVAGAGAAAEAEAGASAGHHELFQSDYAALRRAAEAVDEAVAELSTAHSKRVLRYIR
jgi:hypothetical protein